MGPGIAAGHTVADPVSTLDLGATFCDYGGTNLDHDTQSTSLRSLLENKPGASRDVAYSEWNVNASRCGVPLDLRTVRTRDAKLTVELQSGAGELYNLKDDPNEMNNLYDDTAGTALRKELTDMIHARPGSVCEDIDEPIGMA